MNRDITKIQMHDIKYIVLEALNQLNELSSKDWHDKYLANIPEDVFYVVMGRDKKKTPIKELMFKLYLSHPTDTSKLIDVANKYNSLDGAGTQKVNSVIQTYGVNSFEEFSNIIDYVTQKLQYSDDFGLNITMYDNNCVRLYEDDTWLVLCPLTGEASRKCIAGNGNHWCTCSSNYETHFPVYTYNVHNCIISFLNKKEAEASFQISLDRNGQEIHMCNYFDDLMNYEDIEFPGYKKFIAKLFKSGIIEKLIDETSNRSTRQKRLTLTSQQLLYFCGNKINSILKENPNYFDEYSYVNKDEGIIMERPLIFKIEGEKFYRFMVKYYTSNIAGYDPSLYLYFLYGKKTGPLVLSDDKPYMDFYYVDELITYEYNHFPIGYCESDGGCVVVFYDKERNNLAYAKFNGQFCGIDEETLIPLIRNSYLDIENEDITHKYFDFDCNEIQDGKLSRNIILPKCWGGKEVTATGKIGNNKFKAGDFEGKTFGYGFCSIKNHMNNDIAYYGLGQECLAVLHNCKINNVYYEYPSSYIDVESNATFKYGNFNCRLLFRIAFYCGQISIRELEIHYSGKYMFEGYQLNECIKTVILPNIEFFNNNVFEGKQEGIKEACERILEDFNRRLSIYNNA